MARQAGPYFITGTIGNLSFYKMEGKYYVRQKSSLDGKRVRKDKAFRRTMEYARLLAAGSKVAKVVYWLLSDEQRRLRRIGSLTGEVMVLLKDGMSSEEALVLLKEKYLLIKKVGSVSRSKVVVQGEEFANRVIGEVCGDMPAGSKIVEGMVWEEVPS